MIKVEDGGEVSDLWVVGDLRTLLFAGGQGLANSTFSHVGGLPDLFMEHDAMAEAPRGRPRGRPPRNPEVNMTGESDRASPIMPSQGQHHPKPQQPSLQHGNEHGETARCPRLRQARNR
jgi:hypothetical protein